MAGFCEKVGKNVCGKTGKRRRARLWVGQAGGDGCHGFWLESCAGFLNEMEKELRRFVESVYFLRVVGGRLGIFRVAIA